MSEPAPPELTAALLQRLPELTTQGIGLAKLDATVLYLNRALRRLLAVSEGTELSKYRLHAFYEESVLTERVIPTVLRHGRWHGELELRSLDGRAVRGLHDVLLIHQEGTPVGFATVVMETTERGRLESDFRLRDAAFVHALNGIAITDLAGCLVAVNPAFLALWGYDDEGEVLGRHATDLWDQPSEAEGVIRTLRRIGSWFGRLRALRADGTRFTAELSASVIRDSSGQPSNLVGSFADASGRERFDEALRVSEARLRAAQRIARAGHWTLDTHSGRVEWSEIIYSLLGLDPAGCRPSMEVFLSLLHPEDRRRVQETMEGALSAGYPPSGGRAQLPPLDYRAVRADGEVVWLHTDAEADIDDRGRPALVHGTLHDVTELRRAELRLRESLAEKEMLLREIHHRVKNNLQTISSLLYFHERRVADPAGREVFRDAESRLRAMILVHDQLYRQEELSRVELVAYLRGLTDQLADANALTAYRISLEVSGDPVSLPVERALPAGMAVAELLSNAFKHAFSDGRQGNVSVEIVADSEGDLRIAVSDDGVGLPSELDPDKARSFGFSLLRNVTLQLEGSLRFERGAGTRAILTLPSLQRGAS